MELNIHGRIVSYDGQECGMSELSGDYVKLDIQNLVDELNTKSREEARITADSYKIMVNNQLLRTTLRQVPGFSPLGTTAADFRKQKPYLENTIRVLTDIVTALQE